MTQCLFCHSDLEVRPASEVWSLMQSEAESLECSCVKCSRQLMADGNDAFEPTIFMCPQSLDFSCHPIPLILCHQCTADISKAQNIVLANTTPTSGLTLSDEILKEMETEGIRNNCLYTSYEYFEFFGSSYDYIPHDLPRCMILGPTGVGKSSLLNKISGVRYEYVEEEDCESNDDDDDIDETKDEDAEALKVVCGEPLFDAAWGQKSVTRETSFAKVSYLGDKTRPLIILDTPGSNDNDVEVMQKNEIDLQLKLRTMEHVHVVLVLLSNSALVDGRISKNLESTIRMIQFMFDDTSAKKEGDSFWKHVVIGFAKCDEDSKKQWKPTKKTLRVRKKKFLKYLQNEFRFEHEVSLLTLSSVEAHGSDTWSQEDQFNELWTAISSTTRLSTTAVRLREQIRLAEEKRLREEKIRDAKRAIYRVALKMISKRMDAEEVYHEEQKQKADELVEDPLTGIGAGLKTIGKTFVSGTFAPLTRPVQTARMVDGLLKEKEYGVSSRLVTGAVCTLGGFAVGLVEEPVVKIAGVFCGVGKVAEGIYRFPCRIWNGATAGSIENERHESRVSDLQDRMTWIAQSAVEEQQSERVINADEADDWFLP